ncbi:centromere-associated protein E [Hippocampus comes]|nr:PREDICTED: centromere-associated protein E [Hippocampus comes]
MAEESAVKVCVRVRPIIQREESVPSETAEPVQVFWKSDKKFIHQIDDGSATKSFSFDRVFTAEETTNQVYQDISKPLVVSTVEGYNGTIFAYGQTSSGKTFTMMGSDHVPGVIPLAVDDVFETIKKCPKKEFLLRVSYMEIYNETVTDLLVDSWKRKPLEVRETTNKTIHVVDLTEELVTSPAQVLAWIRKGEKNRHYGKTKMNERSSRSHTVFRMILESRERSDLASGENADGAIIVSHLNLVDLAGSERASQTGAEGTRLKEGCNINRSLFTLGQVIKKLSEDSQSFINYRDSKLTRILQNSLGGNAKTVILCTITTASLDETLRTLQFASTAKKMKNDPHVTEVSDDGALLKRYRNEIVDLKRRLQEVSSETQTTATEREVLSQLLQEKHQLQVEQEDRIRNLTKLLVTSTNLTRVQKVPKRRVTWGGKMLRLAHASPSQDGLSGRSFVEFVDQRRKADSTSVMEMLVEDDEDFDGQWEIPDESSDDISGSEDFITFRSLGNRSVERVAELELELQTVGQQKQQALDQIAAMEEKATEVDLQLKSEAQQKAEAIEKVELLELCVTELKRQLEEQSDKQLQSDEQLEIDFAEIVQRCEILATEKDMLASEQDHLKQELDFAVRQTEKLEKEKTALSQELKEKAELQEFMALEEKIRDEHESELENQICSLKEAMKSRDLQYLELQKNLETVSEELTKKTQIAEDLQNMCGKDVSEEVAKLRLSLADAEVLGRETKKEWAVLRTENIALEELKMTLTVSHKKMEAEVNSLRFQLEAEKSNFKKMQADLQKELNVVFNENLKLTTLLDGKVPRNIMDSVELERTVSNLQKELAASQEAEGDLRAQLQGLKSFQAPTFEVNNPEKQISAEDTVKQELVVAALTEERDQLRMDLQENIDMMIENQEELRTALGKIADLKQRLKQLEDSQTSNLGKPFDDMTTELETLQTQKEQLQAALQEVSEQKSQLEGELQQLIDGAAENESLLHSLQSQLQDQVQRNNDIERMGREKQTQLEHQVEESQHLLHSIHDEFEDLKQKNSTLVKVTEEKESDLKQSIRILSEELETLKAERDDLCFNKEAGHQTLMEETQRLLCRVTSLIEERDQLLDTVEELRRGKIQLKTELEENIEMRTENQAELITAQEKINVLQEEVSLLMNENKDVGKSQERQNQIQRLSEELECAVTERDNIQSEMEKLVCQVTSLREERDQLHGQLQAVGQETNPFRAQLETRALSEKLECVKADKKPPQADNLDNLKHKVMSLVEEQAQLQETLERLNQEKNELAVKLEDAAKTHQAEKMHLIEKFKVLESVLPVEKESRDQSSTEDLENLTCRVISLSEERAGLQETLEILKQEKDQLVAKLEDLTEKYQVEKMHLAEKLDLVEAERDVLQAEKESRFQSAADEVEKLTCTVMSLSEERAQLQETLERLNQEKNQLAAKLEDVTEIFQAEKMCLNEKIKGIEAEQESRCQRSFEELEKLNCTLRSLTEERAQLQETLKELEWETKQLKTELQDKLSMVQQLEEQLNTLKQNETVVQAEAIASQQLLVEAKATISLLNEKLSGYERDLTGSTVTASSRLHNSTLQLQVMHCIAFVRDFCCFQNRQTCLVLQEMGDILEKLWSGLDYYRNEVSAEVRERTRFLKLMQDEHSRPPLVVSRMHSLFSAEADSRSAVLQSRQIYLQGLVDDRNVQCQELEQLTAQAQFQLEEEKSKCVTLQQRLEETPARPELTLLSNNKELLLLHQAEERVKALSLKNKHLEEAQQKNHSCISGYKMDIQRLQTELEASGVQVQELKNAIKTLKSQLQESEKCAPPSVAELQKAQAQLFMKEMELSVASDKHQQEIERMTTVLHMKEELVRKLKESLRTLQQQGEESFLQGQELCDRFLNPRGLVNKSSGVLQNSKLAEEVKQLQIKITHLENVISSQQADLIKWKNRALKMKSKAKVDVKPSPPCTPTKQGLAVCSDFLPQSPKKFVVASQKVLDSPIKLLESPKVPLLDSPKSKFFDKGANLLPGTFPKMFFDNSNLGISADANPDGCASQPPEALESCITQ